MLYATRAVITKSMIDVSRPSALQSAEPKHTPLSLNISLRIRIQLRVLQITVCTRITRGVWYCCRTVIYSM